MSIVSSTPIKSLAVVTPASSNPIAQNRGKIHQEPKKEKQENRGGNNKGDAGGAQLSSGMTTGQHAAFRSGRW